MRSIVARDDAGAVAILYALTLLVMIGFAALVLDLGALRSDRRAAQTTADFASVAAASHLGELSEGSPREACRTALRYFLANTPLASLSQQDIDDFCQDNFPASDDDCWTDGVFPDEGDEIRASIDADPYRVTLTWPVELDSEGYSEEIDGHRCDRFAVQVSRTRDFVFGRALDVDEQGETGAFAVARGGMGGDDELVSSLVVLDPFGCQVVTGSGGGSTKGGVLVQENPGEGPGIITIDSDGAACSPPNNRVIEFSGNNAQVKAGVYEVQGDHQASVDDGFIFSYALTPEAGAAQNDVFEMSRVPLASEPDYARQLAGGHPSPREPIAGSRFTRAPVEYLYDCRGDYSDLGDIRPHIIIDPCEGTDDVPPDSKYITNLRDKIDSEAADPGNEGYTVITGGDCDVQSDWNFATDAPGPSPYWFRCPELRIAATLEIPEGDIVVDGAVKLATNNTNFRVNTTGSDDNYIFIRDGDLDKAGGAAMTLGRPDPDPDDEGTHGVGTFVLIDDGFINMRGGSGDAFTWIAPYAGNFGKLALWSESATTHSLSGSVDNLNVEGVFYMPNAQFDFGGTGEMDQQDAQFISYRFRAHGSGQLRMTPNPERNITDPRATTHLIR